MGAAPALAGTDRLSALGWMVPELRFPSGLPAKALRVR
jgi:hypothetical protein